MALIDNVRVMGSGLNADIRSALTKAKVDGSLTEITQLEMTFTDRGWSLLGSGLIAPGMSVQLDDFNFEISVINTGADGTIENVTVKCRPIIVRKLRERRGPKVMKNVSPSEFVQVECQAVGAKSVVQPSPRRSQVARDVPKQGDQEVEQPPSSWTTFGRLSKELGFIMFEAAGTIYFGKPSWLLAPVGRLSTFTANYKVGAENTRVAGVPQCERSKDSPSVTVGVSAIVTSTSAVRPGKKLVLDGVPTFNGEYIVASFDVDLLGAVNEVSISAATPIDPAPDNKAASGSKTNTRQGTRLASDFIYWIQRQIGNSYVTGVEANPAVADPNVWDGSELVEWSAYQVGAFMPNHPNDQIEYCKASGTEISVTAGIATRGAILWRSNYVGISLGGGQVIEQVKGKVGLVKGGAAARYTRAGKVPGILY